MKKQKLTIRKLRIDSFVTDVHQQRVLGGANTDYKQCGTGYETINSCNYTYDYKECGTGPQTINSCEPTNYYECGTGPV